MRSKYRDPNANQSRRSTSGFVLFTLGIVTAIILAGVFMS